MSRTYWGMTPPGAWLRRTLRAASSCPTPDVGDFRQLVRVGALALSAPAGAGDRRAGLRADRPRAHALQRSRGGPRTGRRRRATGRLVVRRDRALRLVAAARQPHRRADDGGRLRLVRQRPERVRRGPRVHDRDRGRLAVPRPRRSPAARVPDRPPGGARRAPDGGGGLLRVHGSAGTGAALRIRAAGGPAQPLAGRAPTGPVRPAR